MNSLNFLLFHVGIVNLIGVPERILKKIHLVLVIIDVNYMETTYNSFMSLVNQS